MILGYKNIYHNHHRHKPSIVKSSPCRPHLIDFSIVFQEVIYHFQSDSIFLYEKLHARIPAFSEKKREKFS